MSNLIIANKSDLVAIADAIRTKAGISDSLSFPQGFVSGISGISGSGSGTGVGNSGGIDSGYTVNFYNDGELIENHSALIGNYINAPLNVSADSWKNLDNTIIYQFPFTSDVENAVYDMYAIKSTYAEKLLSHWGLSLNENPYIAICVNSNVILNVAVGNKYTVGTNFVHIGSPYMIQDLRIDATVGQTLTNIDSIVNYIIDNNIQYTTQTFDRLVYLNNAGSGIRAFTNFDTGKANGSTIFA